MTWNLHTGIQEIVTRVITEQIHMQFQ